MATTAFRRDFLWRKLVNPASDSRDHLGRATTATVDSTGRALIGTVRANATAYTVGQLVELASGVLMQCTVAGTSNATTPPTAPGYNNTVVDGTVTWRQVTTT